MRKLFCLILVGALCLMAAGCTDKDNSIDPSLYTVSGEVYSVGLDETNTGWPDITMTLENDQGTIATTTTDADGNYTFSVPDGHYWMTPSNPGNTFDSLNSEIDVSGADIDAINFQVMPLLASNVTSTAAKTFKAGRLKYTTNAAFNKFADYADESKKIVIPGLTKTVVDGDASTTMVPQGICFANDYVLISAYDSDEEMNSVIYVILKSDRSFKTVLSLPTSGHVGGLAFDGVNVWVCNGSEMGVIKYSDIETHAESGVPFFVIPEFAQTQDVLTTASFASFYDGRLFVGKFNETSTDTMYGYDIGSKATDSPTLTAAIEMEVPVKTQGIAFREDDGLMIASTSYGRGNYGVLRFYKPNWDEVDSETVALVHKNDAFKTLTVPPMCEGIVIDGDYTYVLFESGAAVYADGASYCVYPMNRVLPFWTHGIVK